MITVFAHNGFLWMVESEFVATDGEWNEYKLQSMQPIMSLN